MDEKEEGIRLQLVKAASNLGLDAGKTIKLDTTPQYGFHFRVTLNNEKILRDKSYIILDSIKGGVRFRNRKTEDLNQEYAEARSTYTSQQKTIVAEIIETAGRALIFIAQRNAKIQKLRLW